MLIVASLKNFGNLIAEIETERDRMVSLVAAVVWPHVNKGEDHSFRIPRRGAITQWVCGPFRFSWPMPTIKS